MKRFRWLAWVLLIFSMAVGISGDIFAQDQGADKVSPTIPLAHESEQPSGPYKIRPGDKLEIITWKEPDFTRECLVRVDGRISFPLIDEVEAAGRTAQEVKQEIQDRLKDYVDNPVVNVIVHVQPPVIPKFYVLGEVQKTGEYPLVKRLTVLQAFAIAGGFTEWASKKEIICIRHENGKDKIIRLNYKNIIKGKDLDRNLVIQPDDTIIVP